MTTTTASVCLRSFGYYPALRGTASTTIEYSRSVPSLYNPIPQLMSVSDALDPIQYLSHYKSHTIFLAGPFEEVLGRYDVLSIAPFCGSVC